MAFLSFLGGSDAEAAQQAIKAKADELCRDQRVRQISFSKLKKYLLVECGYTGNEAGLFVASNKLALVLFAVAQGVDLEPALQDSYTARSTFRENQETPTKEPFPTVYTLTPIKEKGAKVEPPAPNPFAQFASAAADAASALAGSIKKAMPTQSRVDEAASAEAAASAQAPSVEAAAAAPSPSVEAAAAAPSPSVEAAAASSSEANKDAAAALIQQATAQYIRVKAKQPASDGDATMGGPPALLALSVGTGGEVRATLSPNPSPAGLRKGAAAAPPVAGATEEAKDAAALLIQNASSKYLRSVIRPKIAGGSVSAEDPALAAKFAQVKKALGIPDSMPVGLSEIASMVPMKGTDAEKINALHAKLCSDAAAGDATAAAPTAEAMAPAPANEVEEILRRVSIALESIDPASITDPAAESTTPAPAPAAESAPAAAAPAADSVAPAAPAVAAESAPAAAAPAADSAAPAAPAVAAESAPAAAAPAADSAAPAAPPPPPTVAATAAEELPEEPTETFKIGDI